MIRKFIATAAFGIALALGACNDQPQAQQLQAPVAGQPTDKLTIETDLGPQVFRIEVAVTPEQKTTGLMFRREMAADAGMLFPYDRPQIITMWMRNTYLPLDMVFIGADGRVINVAERTVPESLATIPSGGPALGVLEVNAGTAARLHIKPGDRVVHSLFGTAAR